MKFLLPSITLFVFLFNQCSSTSEPYKSDNLEITQLTKNTFIHKSYLNTESFGRVGCNGLIYLGEKKAIIFDTPTTDSASLELIHWITTNHNRTIQAVIVSHFHDDCLGSLKVFHDANIPSFANNLTVQLAREENKTVPINGFTDQLVTNVEEETILSKFMGEGHTRDNIVSYIQTEEVLFGGCLIKQLDAGEGYLGDANVEEWSKTVTSIKKEFPDIKHVVPGHGRSGGVELLDYTIDLFSEYEKGS